MIVSIVLVRGSSNSSSVQTRKVAFSLYRCPYCSFCTCPTTTTLQLNDNNINDNKFDEFYKYISYYRDHHIGYYRDHHICDNANNDKCDDNNSRNCKARNETSSAMIIDRLLLVFTLLHQILVKRC
jgi:hypothetical protein